MAADMASQMERGLFDMLHRTTEEIGNVVDMKGKPITLETYLDMIEKVDMDFDHFGFPEFPTLVYHPSTAAALATEFNRFRSSSILRARAEQILTKKREEWRARESRRRLVD